MKSYKSLVIAVFAASLTLSVCAAEKKSRFAAADKDGDGFLSETEYVAGFKGKGSEDDAKKKFAAIDKDGDKKISADEYKAAAPKGKKKEKKD